MKYFYYVFFLIAIQTISVFGQQSSKKDSIYYYLEEDNFFKAQELFASEKKSLDQASELYIGLTLDNAFNRNQQSQKLVQQAIKRLSDYTDSIQHKIYEIKADNEVKLYDYKAALHTNEFILKKFTHLLTTSEKEDTQNSIALWGALVEVPKQTVIIHEEFTCQMIIDKVGLKNLPISVEKETVQFIFDTGANLSTVTESTAKKMNIKIFPVQIKVGSITGEKVEANIGVCPVFRLGNIEVKNAIFIIFKDEHLSFAQIDYHINGILGYPVIAALKEVHITTDGHFMAGIANKTPYKPNLAMKGLTPLIYIDNMHFTFDTGAAGTLFYKKYYDKYESGIEQKYTPTQIQLGGAGGSKMFEAYLVEHTFHLYDKTIVLKDVQLLKEIIKPDEKVYGNIGQDLIGSFNKMILNFKDMYIKFE